MKNIYTINSRSAGVDSPVVMKVDIDTASDYALELMKAEVLRRFHIMCRTNKSEVRKINNAKEPIMYSFSQFQGTGTVAKESSTDMIARLTAEGKDAQEILDIIVTEDKERRNAQAARKALKAQGKRATSDGDVIPLNDEEVKELNDK